MFSENTFIFISIPDLIISLSLIIWRYYNNSEGPFLHLFFCRDPFCSILLLFKSKKGSFTDFRRKIDKKYRIYFFIWVIFRPKGEIFAYFCLYIQIYYVFNKKNPSYLELILNKGPFFNGLFHDFRHFLGVKKDPILYI